MKKILSALLAMSMAFALLAASANAAAPADDAAAMPVSELAYMDTATASPVQKEVILAARRQIVYGDQAWTVDGTVSVIHKDGTEEKLPEFSSLWPDWDLDEIAGLVPDLFANFAGVGKTVVLFDDTIQLSPQSGGTNAPTFYRFNANGEDVYAWMSSIDKDYKCNIGFNNEDTGKDLGWYPGLGIGGKAVLNTDSGVRYGVRASVTGDTKANARMVVSEDPNYIPSIKG